MFKKIFKTIVVVNFLMLFFVTDIACAIEIDNKYADYSITGLENLRGIQCKQLRARAKRLTSDGVLSEVYEGLLKAQCTNKKEVGDDTFYFAPIIKSLYVAPAAQSCLETQEEIINKKLAGEDFEALKTFYSLGCFEIKQQKVEAGGRTINPVLELNAPIPIEGGGVVEASNKSYLFVYMVKLYKFVLSIVGIIAVVELIIGGFQIGLSAGDTGKAENGKKRIIQTMEGMALIFTSAIILNVLNPQGYNYNSEVVTLDAEFVIHQDHPDPTEEVIPGIDNTVTGENAGCSNGYSRFEHVGSYKELNGQKWFTCWNRGPGIEGDNAITYSNNSGTTDLPSPFVIDDKKRLRYGYIRALTPKSIVAHFTEGDTFSGAKYTLEMGAPGFIKGKGFYNTPTGLPCHVMIDKNAIAYQLTNTLEEESYCQRGLNNNAIGIEVVGRNASYIKTNQIHSLRDSIIWLHEDKNIPLTNSGDALFADTPNGVFSHTQVAWRNVIIKNNNGSGINKFDIGENNMKKVFEELTLYYKGHDDYSPTIEYEEPKLWLKKGIEKEAELLGLAVPTNIEALFPEILDINQAYKLTHKKIEQRLNL